MHRTTWPQIQEKREPKAKKSNTKSALQSNLLAFSDAIMEGTNAEQEYRVIVINLTDQFQIWTHPKKPKNA